MLRSLLRQFFSSEKDIVLPCTSLTRNREVRAPTTPLPATITAGTFVIASTIACRFTVRLFCMPFRALAHCCR